MAKLINLTVYDQDWKLGLFTSTYQIGGNIYIGLFDVEHQEPFADVTVNVSALPEGQGCVNTNDYPWLVEFIANTGIGVPTGNMLRSEFGAYPVYKFNLEKIKEYTINLTEE